jgi:endonuclease-3 related protein
LTALLVHQCDWSHARDAVRALGDKQLLTIRSLADINQEQIKEAIRGVRLRFPNQSAKAINGLANSILSRGYEQIEDYLASGRDTKSLRNDLLSIHRVGPETADCCLLFAGEHPQFVIDACTRRVFERLRLFPELDREFWSGQYGELKAFFEANVLADMSLYDAFVFAPGIPREVALFRDFHAQILELARHHCTKSDRRCHRKGAAGWKRYEFCNRHCPSNACDRCPLADHCTLGRSVDSKR